MRNRVPLQQDGVHELNPLSSRKLGSACTPSAVAVEGTSNT